VCEKPPVDALDVSSVLVCRACAARVGRLLEGSGDAVLSTVWKGDSLPDSSTRYSHPALHDAEAHYRLGCAYADAGMSVDAIRELAIALRPAAPNATASAAFARIFLSQDARPEALGDIILAFMREPPS
jgi:hypothetical protein